MWPKRLLPLLLAWMLTGCASCMPPSTALPMPASLRQPCPPLTKPADGTAGAVLRWAADTALAYRECADRQRALVQALDGRAD